MLEFQQFQEKIRRELRAKMKFSKDLLELRDKEAKLVKVKRYEEAEKVKMKADLLEEFERNKLEAEVLYKSILFVDVSGDREEGSQIKTSTAVGTSGTAEKNLKR